MSEQESKSRRWKWWVIGVVGVVLLGVMVAGPVVGMVVKRKLVEAVAERTNGSLRVGQVTYVFPYGVSVGEASFVAPDGDGGEVEVVKVKGLELKLAKLPLGSGPLVIERVGVDRPEVRMIRTGQGIVGVTGVVKERAGKERVKKKLSELFELRRLAVTEGRVTYEDRTRPGFAPMVWGNLNINTEMRPASAGVYAYEFRGENGKLATVRSAGRVNIDALVLDAQSLGLDVQVGKKEGESAVPAQVQRVLEAYQVEGKVGIAGKGHVPLRDMGGSAYEVEVSLDEGKGVVPGYQKKVERLAAKVHVTGRAHEAITSVVSLEGASGEDVLHVNDGEVTVDLGKKAWELKRLDLRVDASPTGVRPVTMKATTQPVRAGGKLEMTVAGSGPLGVKSLRDFVQKVKFEAVATLSDFELQPPGFGAPVHLVTGAPITANQDVVRISNLTGRYGEDQFQITTMRIPLRDLPQIARVDQVSMTATFDRNTPGYPGKVGEWMKKVRPAGPFEVGGQAMYDRQGSPKLDYHLLVHSDQGAFEWTDGPRRIPVTRIHTDILMEPEKAQVDYLEANVFGGVLAASGSARMGQDLAWKTSGEMRDFDLRTCVQELTGKEFDTEKLAGRAFARFDLSGGKRPESVKGSGQARLFNGKLFEVPVLADVLGTSGFGRGLVASEAAATVEIADAKVNVKRAAIGGPAVGMQGRGVIGFDKSLDLDVVVAPLGEWKQQLKQTGIPVVSKVLGDMAGVVQGLVNKATSALLYEFQVSGTADQPKVLPIPAPILTKGAASIFGAMLGEEKGKLAEEVGKAQEEK